MRFIILLIISIFFCHITYAEMVDYSNKDIAHKFSFPSESNDGSSIYAKALFDAIIMAEVGHSHIKKFILSESKISFFCEEVIHFNDREFQCNIKILQFENNFISFRNMIDERLLVIVLSDKDSSELYHSLKGPREIEGLIFGYSSSIIDENGIYKVIKVFNNGPLEIFCSFLYQQKPKCRITFDHHKNF